MMQERIQKVMADNGMCSRRAAEKIIEEGRVKVNGHPVKLGDKMDPVKDLLSIDGQTHRLERKKEFIYLMLNKPRGYVTTLNDELGRKTIKDLISDIPRRIYPVGRLDKDSEGLLILTNDGEFANLLMHPSHQVSKLYRVSVKNKATEEQLAKLASGVILDDGSKTQPASIHVVAEGEGRTVMEIAIKEGKNRQVRRMCDAVGLEVIRLKRSAEGPIKLGMLQPGKHRPLEKSEVAAIRASASKSGRKANSRGK